MDFSGKVVLITGASTGVGAATAIYLSGLGAKLALTGSNEAILQKTVDQCRIQNEKAEILSILCDIGKEKDLEKIIEQTTVKYDALDALVNNAGLGSHESLQTTTLELYDSTFNRSVRGVLYLTKLALPHLIKSKGCVVNVSSVTSLRPMPECIAYGMSNAALDHFTKCLALDVASKQVRVNSVNPGIVEINPDNAYYKSTGKLHPIGRNGKPEEVAAAIAFLASELALNITGAILSVDGGLGLGFSSR